MNHDAAHRRHKLEAVAEIMAGVFMSPQDEAELRAEGVDPAAVQQACRERLARIAEGKRDE